MSNGGKSTGIRVYNQDILYIIQYLKMLQQEIFGTNGRTIMKAQPEFFLSSIDLALVQVILQGGGNTVVLKMFRHEHYAGIKQEDKFVLL